MKDTTRPLSEMSIPRTKDNRTMRNATLTMRTLLAIAVGLGAWGLTSQAAFAAPIYSDEIMALSPIDYWRLGEGSGDAQDEATDGTPTGTYDSNVTRQAAGPSSSEGFGGFGSSNDAAGFGGTTSSKIDFPDSTTSYTPVSGDGARTIIAWVNPSSVAGDSGRQVITHYGSSGTGERFRFALNNGKLELDIAGVNLRADNALSTANQWYMLTLVVPATDPGGADDPNDGGDATIDIEDVDFFVDGSAITASDINPFAGRAAYDIDTQSNDPFTIGGEGGSSNFDGLIDEVAVFDKALTATQISDLYSTATIPEPATLALLGLGGAVMLSGRKRRHA